VVPTAMMRPPFAQLAQYAIHRDALVDAGDWPKKTRQGGIRTFADPPADEILGMQHPDDIVDRAAVDGQPRERALRDDADRFRKRRGDVERRNPSPRDHELFGLTKVEPQGALQPLVLVGFEEAAVAALGDQELNFIRGMNMPVGL